MASRSVVVASNYWHKPGITVSFLHDETSPKGSVHVQIPVEDLLKAIIAEMPGVMHTLTKSKRDAAIMQAYASALEKVKEATIKAV